MNHDRRKSNFLIGIAVSVFLFFCSLYTKFFIYVFKKLADYQNLKLGDTSLKLFSDEFLAREKEPPNNMKDIIQNNAVLKSIYDKKEALTKNIKNYGSVGLIKHAKPPEVKESIPVSIEEGDGIENGHVINALIEKSRKEKVLPFIEMNGLLNKKDIENAINELDAAIDNEVFKIIDLGTLDNDTKVSLETAAKSLAANKKLKNSAPRPKKKPKSSQKTKKVAKNKRNTYKKK